MCVHIINVIRNSFGKYSAFLRQNYDLTICLNFRSIQLGATVVSTTVLS